MRRRGYALHALVVREVEGVACAGGDDGIDRRGQLLQEGLGDEFDATAVSSYGVTGEDLGDAAVAGA